jgi:hypothetical protein
LSPPKVKIGEKQTNEIHREKTQKGRRNKKPTGPFHPHRIAFSVLIFALSTPGKSKTTTATNQNQHNQLQQLFFSFLKIKETQRHPKKWQQHQLSNRISVLLSTQPISSSPIPVSSSHAPPLLLRVGLFLHDL